MMPNSIHVPMRLFIVVGFFGLTASAFAERADRDKPVNLEADRIVVDEARKEHVLEGNVQLTQGTLVILSERLVISQDAKGFQKGTATGGPNGMARFRQRREGKDEFVEGEAERIVHDGRNEKTEFFQRAHVRSGSDEVRGNFISYDGRSENYVVTGQGDGRSTAANGKGERVRAVIQPKHKPDESAVSRTPSPSAATKTSSEATSTKEELTP
jgi:lipopolysaccharide export system protein LptA